MKRYLTLDVTHLSEDGLSKFLNNVTNEIGHSDYCRAVEVQAYGLFNRKYVEIKGETDYLYENLGKQVICGIVSKVVYEFPSVEYVFRRRKRK